MKQVPYADTVEDAEWLLENGVSPFMIPQQLGRSASSIEKAARSQGKPELAKTFATVHSDSCRKQRVSA